MGILIDYSTSRPPTSVLHAAGVSGVGRYIGWDSVPGYPSIGKNLTSMEAEGLLRAGLSIFLAFEYQPDAAARGSAQGRADGQLAISQLRDLGAPSDMAVYFALDYDVPDYAPSLPDTPANALEKLGPIGAYFQAIRALRPSYGVGGYGGYYAIHRLLDAGLIRYAWQTVAWSGGQRDDRAQIYQLAVTAPIVGADVDIREHTSDAADYGQWPRPAADPTPRPAPKPARTKEHDMVIVTVTAPTTGASFTGTESFLYSPGTPPVHIVSEADRTAFEQELGASQPQGAGISWEQFVALGGS